MIYHCFACDNEFDGDLINTQAVDPKKMECPVCHRIGYIFDVWVGGHTGILMNDLNIQLRDFLKKANTAADEGDLCQNQEDVSEIRSSIHVLRSDILATKRSVCLALNCLDALEEELNKLYK